MARRRDKRPKTKRAASGKSRRGRKRPIRAGTISERERARAAARAEARLEAERDERPSLRPEDLAEEALAEAQALEMLLDESDEAQDPEPHEEEEEYFLKPPPRNPSMPRVRPAPEIIDPPPAGARSDDADTGRSAARAERRVERAAGSSRLFPRNFKIEYPVAVRGKGVWLEDDRGRKYLDGGGGAAVCSIGHGVEEVAAVMTPQAQRLAFVHSSQFITRESLDLSARLAALAPGEMKRTGRVYLVSGGSEAVETAIKLARQYHLETGRPTKSKVLGRWQSYHGSTMGALAVTGHVGRRAFYTPLFAAMPHVDPCFCYRCPYGLKYPSCEIACAEHLEATIRQEGPDTVAAFIAEPVVGATLGAAPAVDGYWTRVREICTEHQVLLIADEVMTGIGRTGRNFAVDRDKVVPDLITVGKGLSGGYAPLGAVIARDFVAGAIRDGRGYFEHGFTYSANPMSAAVGSAVLGYIERHKLVSRAARVGKLLGARLESLRRHRFVGDVRGVGMMWGLEFVRDRKSREPFPAALKLARRLYELCLEEGLLIYPGAGTRQGHDGDHCLIAPALTISRPEIDQLVSRLDRALQKLGSDL